MPATHETTSLYRTPAHFARLLGVHTNTVIRWFRDGVAFTDGSRQRPRHVRTPGGYRATEADVREFLELIKADRLRPEAPSPGPGRARVGRMRDGLAKAGF
jgi:hypothetical protein